MVLSAEDAAQLELVTQARAGSVDAFEALYRMHSGAVYLLCLRLAGGMESDATELLQDVFVRAWRGLTKFRGDSAFGSWLHRLAVNSMLQQARSEKRRTARVLPMADTESIGAASLDSDPDSRMDLENAIAGLPHGARVAFVLHEIEGFQHQEIAAQLGVAVGTVKSQVHRARKLLISALNK
ncbi:MAG: sigma-70 family RNA polymerase sigma factor [Gemmatimonadaceae bacterium]|nr:sigma-70 family RNA polymerase sigma factor [Gemmatimonadaceae bacterium]